MSVKFVTIDDKDQFDKAAKHPLQSWEWGEFREKTGNQVVRIAITNNDKIIDSLQLTLHKIPLTAYKIGAVIKGPEPTKEMLDALKELAKRENCIFIKMEPSVATGDSSKYQVLSSRQKEIILTLLQKNGAVRGKTLFTPTTFWIDLSPSEEKLMASFHPKTRYNIRLAQKKGVTVVEDNSDEAFAKYLELTRETVQRQGFYAHTETYHRLMWKALHQQLKTDGKQPIARLLTARFNNEIITSWIVFVWHDFLYYPYGASTERYKEAMANNLMMWEAIRYGKKLGLRTFDLWGREEGKGFTKFKEGYNPAVVEFLGTWDLVTSPLYPLYCQLEKLRWKILKTKAKFSITKPAF